MSRCGMHKSRMPHARPGVPSVRLAVPLTIDALAAIPRWSDLRTLALAGSVRGDTLGAWGDNLVARFGVDALARVRARVPATVAALPRALGDRDRVPVFAQLLLTEAIVDECLGGDILTLYTLLVADTRAGLGRIRLALLRTLGAAGALRLGPRTFRQVHERGDHTVQIEGRRADLAFHGNPLFGHPTWRVLQLFATQLVLELAGSPSVLAADGPGDDAFHIRADWGQR